MVDDINDYTKKIVECSIIVEADSSITVWEFKDKVSRLLSLCPKMVRLTLKDGSHLLDSINGQILNEINIRSGDIIYCDRLPIID